MRLFLFLFLFFHSSYSGFAEVFLKTGTLHLESNVELKVDVEKFYIVEKLTSFQLVYPRIVDYLPENSYLVFVKDDFESSIIKNLVDENKIRIGLYKSQYKFNASTMSESRSYYVYSANTCLQSVASLQSYTTEIRNIKTDDEFNRIVNEKCTVWIEPFVQPQLLDTIQEGAVSMGASESGSGVALLNVAKTYQAGIKGADQIVAVADTGFDLGIDNSTLHPDLRSKILLGKNIAPWGELWDDPNGHGTHVACLVLGNGSASNGNYFGTAPDSKLVALSLWSPILNNLGIPSTNELLFGVAKNAGANIQSNSWGTMNFGAYDALARRVDEFTSANPDFLPIFAAGNSGADKDKDGRIDFGSVISPATSKNALTVGASENVWTTGGNQTPIGNFRTAKESGWDIEPYKNDLLSNNENGIAVFSSRGPTLDGRIKPEILAPGTNNISCRSRHTKAGILWGVVDDFYVYAGGTSMAAPLAAGAVSLIRSCYMKKFNSSPSSALLKALTLNGSKDLFPGQYGNGKFQEIPEVRPNMMEGWGRINVDESCVVTSTLDFVEDNRIGLKEGEEKNLGEFVLDAGKHASITLSWTDLPAAPNAAKTLVNDLDLIVIDEDGIQYFPNNRKVADHLNNSEQVDLKISAKTRKISMKVRAHRVINSGQPQTYGFVAVHKFDNF